MNDLTIDSATVLFMERLVLDRRAAAASNAACGHGAAARKYQLIFGNGTLSAFIAGI